MLNTTTQSGAVYSQCIVGFIRAMFMFSPVFPHKNSVTLIILTSQFFVNNVCLQCTVKAETDVTVCSTGISTVLDIEIAASEDPQCTSEDFTTLLKLLLMSLKNFELKSNFKFSEIGGHCDVNDGKHQNNVKYYNIQAFFYCKSFL